jgi:hypothetical protein
MEESVSVDDMLREGIEAAQAGMTLRARTLLSKVVLEMPRSEEAWWWLGQSVQDPKQREYCFRKVVEINPSHEGARVELGMSPAPTTLELRAAKAAAKPKRKRGPGRGAQRLILAILILGVILIAIGGGAYVALDSLGYLDQALRGDFSFIGSLLPAAATPNPSPIPPPTATFENVSLASIPTWTPTPSPTPRPSTPTPTATPVQPPPGTPTEIPPTPSEFPSAAEAQTVDITIGTGFLTLFPGDFIPFRFEPEATLDMEAVAALTFHVQGIYERPLTLEVYLWNPSDATWTAFGAGPGDNPITPAAPFVDRQGVVIAALRNWGDEPLDITNASFTFAGLAADGSEVYFGLTRQEIRPPGAPTPTQRFSE